MTNELEPIPISSTLAWTAGSTRGCHCYWYNGVDADHTPASSFHGQVKQQVWHRYGTPLSEDDHGTHVAGTFHYSHDKTRGRDLRLSCIWCGGKWDRYLLQLQDLLDRPWRWTMDAPLLTGPLRKTGRRCNLGNGQLRSAKKSVSLPRRWSTEQNCSTVRCNQDDCWPHFSVQLSRLHRKWFWSVQTSHTQDDEPVSPTTMAAKPSDEPSSASYASIYAAAISTTGLSLFLPVLKLSDVARVHQHPWPGKSCCQRGEWNCPELLSSSSFSFVNTCCKLN